MKNKHLWLVLAMGLTVILGACGKEAAPVENIPMTQIETTIEETLSEETTLEEGTVEETTMVDTTEENKETIPVVIYYGNDSADGLLTEEIAVGELTAETIIQELATKNIVSMDTKVNDFKTVESSKEVILHLDLSKEFAEYVGTMGTSGEYIVMGSLTNTFLDAFDGTSIVLSIDGNTLETGHSIYDTPLVEYPMSTRQE